jgi:hypothetical protein
MKLRKQKNEGKSVIYNNNKTVDKHKEKKTDLSLTHSATVFDAAGNLKVLAEAALTFTLTFCKLYLGCFFALVVSCIFDLSSSLVNNSTVLGEC